MLKAKPRPPAPTRPERNDWRARLRAETDEHKYARLEPSKVQTAFRKRMAKEADKKPRPAVSVEGGDEQAENTAQTERMFPKHETDGQGFGLPESDDIPF